MFLTRDGGRVRGLSRPERRAIQEAYDAGQTILLLQASVHDIEALHVLVKEGVTYRSSTDPVVLAYALRQESDIPTARIVHDLWPSLPAPRGIKAVDPEDYDERALQRALDVVISELTHPPVLAAATANPPAAGPADWSQSPVQTGMISWNGAGNFNTPIDIYALHSCQENKDYYLVDTGGDWTATEAAWSSASTEANPSQIWLTPDLQNLEVDWQRGSDQYCSDSGEGAQPAQRICVYLYYPEWYHVEMVPPSGPTVVQVNAVPAADQGLSASYTSGFSFSIGGQVSISGDGPSGGIQAGATWENDVTTTVPPLVIWAGDTGPGLQGAYTTYQYCTVGTSPEDCRSVIQMTNPSGSLCQSYEVGQPQQGQTPAGRLSDVVQTVYWQVDPATYGGSTTFDVTVTWSVNIAASQGNFWSGQFFDFDTDNFGTSGQTVGFCNDFGCSCSLAYSQYIETISNTFKVPIPSQNCPSG